MRGRTIPLTVTKSGIIGYTISRRVRNCATLWKHKFWNGIKVCETEAASRTISQCATLRLLMLKVNHNNDSADGSRLQVYLSVWITPETNSYKNHTPFVINWCGHIPTANRTVESHYEAYALNVTGELVDDMVVIHPNETDGAKNYVSLSTGMSKYVLQRDEDGYFTLTFPDGRQNVFNAQWWYNSLYVWRHQSYANQRFFRQHHENDLWRQRQRHNKNSTWWYDCPIFV